jgi:GT2 family glycosyltransferase
MSIPKVLTVILNYRTADMTLRAAQSACVAMKNVPGAIVVVDNDSRDGSFEKMRDAVATWEFDRIRVVASPRNGGFGAGNNYGMAQALPDGSPPDFVYLLNSDAFPDPNAIEVLRDYMVAHPECGITGSYIEGEDGVPHTTAFRFPTVLSEFENAARTGVITRMLENHVVALPTPDHACKIDWTPGASFMMRRKMIDEVGSFDEGYFLYFEETDLCLRAQRQGWETHFVPESRIMHIGSVSTGMREWARTPTYWFDSRQRYFTKNHGRTAFWAANLARLGGGLLWRLRVLLSNRPLGEAPFFLSDLIWHAVTPRKDRMS